MTLARRPLAFIAFILLCATGSVAQPDITPIVIDHTPAASAENVPEALADLALPEGTLDRLTEVHSADEGVRSVQVAWLSGDRYLWRVQLPEPLADNQRINLYLDADANAQTGREDASGAEILAQWGPDYTRNTEWMADDMSTRDRGLRTAVDGATLWATIDCEMAIRHGQARFSFWITSSVGNTDTIEATIPAEGPQPVRFAAGEEVGPGGLRLNVEGPGEGGDGFATRVTITNTGDRERWIDLSVPYTLNMDGPVRWFDAFHFTPHEVGEHALKQHGISAVLPLTAAWDGQTGIAMAFDPMDWYSEAHASIRATDGGHEMRIGSRLALIPGESHTFTVNVLPYDGSTGWRGAFDAYWAIFPEVYERAEDIDPRFHQASAGGLYRSWSDPADEEFAIDLIRRIRGKWEWGYAPAPRPGEWAVTDRSIGNWTRRGDVTKSATAESLEESRDRIRGWVHETAKTSDVAVAYYMHLKNVEKGLMERYWSDSYFRNEPIEYIGYYAGVPCWFAYPMANGYGEYMEEAIPMIAERFEPAGMAFDSVFGFIPHWGPSADRSPGTTFENGRAFVGEGIGFAHQMDVVRSQRTMGHRTAMVTNLKLPTLSADAVRTDSALLEFHPMNNPTYRERILRLRMLSGQIMFSWWHRYDPKYYDWIPWDELNQQQTIDAFQRLRDDILIHSLYYGATPCGRFAVGVPKIVDAIPMLVEISARGWQPVIGAEPSGADLLISRYGDGLGMGLGVGNQTYEQQAGWVVLDEYLVSDGEHYAFAAWGDEPTRTDLYPGTPNIGVSVPPRDVKALRAVVSLPRDHVAKAFVSGTNALPVEQWRKHVEGWWQIGLGGVRPAGPMEIAIWLPEHAAAATALVGGDAVACERDGSTLRLTVTPENESVELKVIWRPKVALQGDREALLDYAFVADGKPNCNIVAGDGGGDLAFRVQEYFREYYRWAVDEPQTVRLPIVSPEQTPDGRRVVVGLLDNMPDDLQIDPGNADAVFGVTGDVVFATARTPEMLEKAVEGLLFTLDERYWWYGPFYPTQHFFRGDPSNSPQALQDAGMAGTLLTGEDTGSLREVTDLPDLIEW